jgi:hypothetical protein
MAGGTQNCRYVRVTTVIISRLRWTFTVSMDEIHTGEAAGPQVPCKDFAVSLRCLSHVSEDTLRRLHLTSGSTWMLIVQGYHVNDLCPSYHFLGMFSSVLSRSLLPCSYHSDYAHQVPHCQCSVYFMSHSSDLFRFYMINFYHILKIIWLSSQWYDCVHNLHLLTSL